MKVSIKKLLSWIFTLSLVLFMLMGIGIVLVQAVALVTANGALSIAAAGTPKSIVILLSAIAGFAGFIYSYFKEGNS
ncbi:hypothetical protein [Anaerotruncus massiliensis (ex Togo et al. 2019)]|uniref:hypothetical protein n=1 Tax=Anaerotruncus TaxID=244127 RepID=UPI000C75A265|nr:hypothetical protein [Anaerotruncus massiliensis (ex Togo et al. 2019)]